jgi:predicted metal-binding membrane protein
MVLLFVGGVMNLFWIAALAILVLVEKAVPFGRLVARVARYCLHRGRRMAATQAGDRLTPNKA